MIVILISIDLSTGVVGIVLSVLLSVLLMFLIFVSPITIVLHLATPSKIKTRIPIWYKTS